MIQNVYRIVSMCTYKCASLDFIKQEFSKAGTESNRLRPQRRHMLVGGIPTPLKNMKVNGDDYAQ